MNDNKNQAVSAADFRKTTVYESARKPGYAAWVSLFPGEGGKWYIGCEEASVSEDGSERGLTPAQWYRMGLPNGYDKWKYRMELLLLESADGMETWDVISREPVRQTGGSFAQAYTGRNAFIRFVWSSYNMEPNVHNGDILLRSEDGGRSWSYGATMHDDRFCSYPHRLRKLKDGTLVAAVPFHPAFDDRRPRTAANLNAEAEMQMTLIFSGDRGATWTSPLPIFGSQEVSETDFVELPSGDLLCINSSIYANPGRQIVYRTASGFMPGPFERTLTPEHVPETVCLTDSGILVGCMRGPWYAWSDDYGLTWQRLAGLPDDLKRDVYQPWIEYLGDGQIVCAGHYGHDDPLEKDYDNFIMLHRFRLEQGSAIKETEIGLVRDYDAARKAWNNAYTLALTCEGRPLAGAEIRVWYVERDQPGYDACKQRTLRERMEMGGTRVLLRTDERGEARLELPHLDKVTDIHHTIQLVATYNADRRETRHRPATTWQYEFYSRSSMQDG